ncbi:MAG: MFS transporter [Paludibacteraceae bacterium]|nr:MFS transporter [Paludibacteraceae bacterium]
MKRFTALYFTNFWGVLNDNFLKTLSCFVAVKWVTAEYQPLVISMAAGALVLPYILLSPLAERMTSLYSKKRIVQIFKWLEIPIVAVGVFGFYIHNVWVVITAIVLMGTQSSLYSPAKYGLIRDIGGVRNVSTGMGGMEAIAFLGMLAGTVAASFLAEKPIYISYILLAGFAILGLIGSLTIKAQETLSNTNYSVNPFRFYLEGKKVCDGCSGILPVVRTLSIFWWMAATLQMGLIVYCPAVLGMSSLQTGITLAIAAIGITMGCIVAGYIDRKHSIIHFTPIFEILLVIESLAIFFIPWQSLSTVHCQLSIFIFALTAGFFKIPLDAEIQKNVKGSTLNLVLAFFNQVSFIYILIASGTFALMTMVLPISYMFIMIALVMFAASIYIFLTNRTVLGKTFKRILHYHYDISVVGEECMMNASNRDKPCTLLVLPTHKAVADPFIIMSTFSDYNLTPLVDEGYYGSALFRTVLKTLDSIKVPDLRKSRRGANVAKRLTDITINALESGKNVVFYPTGHITTDGTEKMEGRKLAFEVCSRLPENVKVIAVRIDGLWGSRTSRYGRSDTPNLIITFLRYFYKFFGVKRPVTLNVEDITAQALTWTSGHDKTEFNNALEAYYNKFC